MKTLCSVFAFLLLTAMLCAQAAKPAADSAPKAADLVSKESANARAYSGMYAFLKDGEFVQITVDDPTHVTGYVSRFGDGGSDKAEFIDHYFKNGKVDGNKLTFSTEIVRGLSFDFKGAVERGEGKTADDEAYFVLKGTLTENATDANKKVTSHASEVALKMFPKEPAPGVKK